MRAIGWLVVCLLAPGSVLAADNGSPDNAGKGPNAAAAAAQGQPNVPRDPFRPFNLALRPKAVEPPATPLEQYAVGSLKLVAVIYDTQNPKAMVEDDAGLGYTIGPGMKIGNQGGVVKTIDPDRIVVEEDFVDFYGEKKKTEIVLRLKPEGEKRP
jgi:Tfp pilus assembly protein PilP